MLNTRIFVIGDVHGCYKTLVALLEKIQPDRTDTLVFLGDYIDRGPRSKETIDLILKLKEEGYQLKLLMGNHEWMLLDNLKTNNINWFYNGAENTLQSFGIKETNHLESIYIQFFQNLELYWQHNYTFFVHAGFSDNEKNWDKEITQMLWTRNEDYKSHYFQDKVIIHGHTPISIRSLKRRILNGDNVLNIDTGCVYDFRDDLSKLTAIELPSRRLFSVENCD